jgi:uncharacterized protein YjeT (DUF2065 family)
MLFCLVDSQAMKLFLLLIGLIMVLESLPYVAAPEVMRVWLRKLSETEPGQLRAMGLVILTVGLLICFIVQKTSLFL